MKDSIIRDRPKMWNSEMLTCFSFFTNSERAIPVQLIDPNVLNDSLEIAKRHRGRLITPEHHFEIKITEGFGVATIQITHEWRIISVASIVWSSADEDYAWRGMLKTHSQMAQPKCDLDKPATCPWLAIILAPEFTCAYSAQEIAFVERINWALAWGLLEKYHAICASN